MIILMIIITLPDADRQRALFRRDRPDTRVSMTAFYLSIWLKKSTMPLLSS